MRSERQISTLLAVSSRVVRQTNLLVAADPPLSAFVVRQLELVYSAYSTLGCFAVLLLELAGSVIPVEGLNCLPLQSSSFVEFISPQAPRLAPFALVQAL